MREAGVLCAGSGGGIISRGRDGWEVKGRGGRRCMLAWEQYDGCATCAVETDNLRQTHLRVAKIK